MNGGEYGGFHKGNAWTHKQSEAAQSKGPLLPRLGGEPVLVDWVNGFYDNMLADKTLGARLKKWMQTAPADFYMQHLKNRTVDYLAVVWSGDDWEGQDLYLNHMHLQITEADFDICIKMGQKKLKTMGLSKELQQEVLDEMMVMKEPISDPGGKFRKWIEARQAELAAKCEEGAVAGPMGFSTSRKLYDVMQAKEQKEKERKEKMEKAKQQRILEEKKKKKEEKAKKKQSKQQAASASPGASPGVSPCPSRGSSPCASPRVMNAPREANAQMFVPAPVLPEEAAPGVVPASHATPLLICAT